MSSLNRSPDRRSEQLRKLTAISRALTYTLKIEDVLRMAADRAAELLHADGALLMLADEEGLLRIRASRGVPEESLQRFREPLDETLITRLQGLLGPYASESFLGVPLVAHGAVTGLLAVVRSSELPPNQEEEWLLSAVADQVAVALENARLEEQVRREREERLRAVTVAGEADEASDRALATLSHDLRSPLNAIDSYAELMEMEILGPVSDQQREALGRMRMSGRHLLAVLENVLEMTRLSAGAIRVRSTSVPAAKVVEEAMLLVGPSAAAKDHAVTVTTDPDLVIAADPDRLRQVLVNLIGNAIKYTRSGGSIRVTAFVREVDGSEWGAIAVADTGSGIAPEKLEAIFQPYYRIPSEDGDTPDGVGLGLAISRELIRQMGGDIEVESQPGHGCTFMVRLPMVDASELESCRSGVETPDTALD